MLLRTLLAGLAGVLAGGLVNVLADELPPGGEAPAAISPTDAGSSPWLRAWTRALKWAGRWRALGQGAPGWRHPLTEIGLGLTWAFLAFRLGSPCGPANWGQFFFFALYTFIMATLAVIDLEHRLLPLQ